MRKINKKGQMFLDGPMGLVLSIIVGLFVLTILTAAIGITNGQLVTNLGTLNENTTSANTQNAIIQNSSEGVMNFSKMQPVLWTMVGISALLGIVGLGVLGFMYYRNRTK